MAGTWRNLGTAAGSVTVGVNRIEVDPGKWATPAHCHGAEEEIFFVLGGSGLSWQDEKVYEVGPGDCLVHLPGREAHTLRAGPDGLDVLAFGQRIAVEVCHYPRMSALLAWPGFTTAERAGPAAWEREVAAGEPEMGEPERERPPSIKSLDEVEPGRWDREGHRSVARQLARAAGSVETGLNHVELEPGQMGAPPHCHSAEEEIFVVLDGEGVCLLGDEEHPVRRGHVVARPAGTRIAHAFRAGDGALTYLVYGTREPNDIAYYPRSGKIYFRGVGVIGRIEQLDYWDGEA